MAQAATAHWHGTSALQHPTAAFLSPARLQVPSRQPSPPARLLPHCTHPPCTTTSQLGPGERPPASGLPLSEGGAAPRPPRPWRSLILPASGTSGCRGLRASDVAPGPPDVRVPCPGQAAGESGRTRGRGWEFSLLADLKASRTSSPLGSRGGAWASWLSGTHCPKEKFPAQSVPRRRAALGASQSGRENRAVLQDAPKKTLICRPADLSAGVGLQLRSQQTPGGGGGEVAVEFASGACSKALFDRFWIPYLKLRVVFHLVQAVQGTRKAK
ncbi:uncharacterized protein LOC144331400 [Macaca mulatta]